ncbi:MAG: sodium:solute symporter [Deltaproteobacteria bacterium]|nr:sodium:solute symporter [Deltaproteobacteria bacterium]
MSSSIIAVILVVYFIMIGIISFVTGRAADGSDSFYSGEKRSPWFVVAVGMIGATLSGISVISVPGMVRSVQFTYMQMVVGFFFGYLVVAALLLPLYYKLNLTSIYSYLGNRFGTISQRTASLFFILSKSVGAAARLYVAAIVLQQFIFDAWRIPFALTMGGTLFIVYLYTFKGGIKTIVWTDFFQTIALVLAAVLLLVDVMARLDLNIVSAAKTISESQWSLVFVFEDWHSRQNFFKQFFSGIFVVIVMTGLDQDIMQKNLSCKTCKDARRTMLWYGFAFIPVNLIFLSLGALILVYASQRGIMLPTASDDIVPSFANQTGVFAAICFVTGIVAATFSSIDSALTSLTTSFSVDILNIGKSNTQHSTRQRMVIHFGFTVFLFFLVLLFRALNSKSAIDAIYTIVSYTYGPLLGLFAFGLFMPFAIKDKWTPLVAILSPAISFCIDYCSKKFANYAFGYELLMINGAITFAGICLIIKKKN